MKSVLSINCLVDKSDDQITAQDFIDLIERIPLKPRCTC
jgi:hypothetical protein